MEIYKNIQTSGFRCRAPGHHGRRLCFPTDRPVTDQKKDSPNGLKMIVGLYQANGQHVSSSGRCFTLRSAPTQEIQTERNA